MIDIPAPTITPEILITPFDDFGLAGWTGLTD